MKSKVSAGILAVHVVLQAISTNTFAAERGASRSDRPTRDGSSELLSLGDPMPHIGQRANWLKGDPIPSFEKGKIYVIDLWATWCGPCIAAIPETSELADKYRNHDVTIIGLALDPKGATPTKRFVQKNKSDFHYSVCEDIDSQLHSEYMARAGIGSIPTAMIIDKEGRLAWIGRPTEMGGPLAEMVLGTYDLEAQKNKRRNGVASTGGRRAPTITGEELYERLKKQDTNGDGLFSAVELARGGTFDPGRIRQMDLNDDYLLSKEELVAYIEKLKKRAAESK